MKQIFTTILFSVIYLLSFNQGYSQCPILNQVPVATNSSLCGSGTSSISIPSSEVGILYSLVSGTTAVSPTLTGNGGSLVFSTGSLTTTTTFSVAATNGTCAVVMTPAITITVNPLPTITIVASNTTICRGQVDTLTVSGALTYTWVPSNSNLSTFTVSPNNTTSYTVTGTDANGCSNAAIKSVSVNPTPTITINATPFGGLCAGQTASLTATGASSYVWSNSLTTASITVSPTVTTVYTVTGTNANGCSASRTRTITVNPTATITINGPSLLCIGASANLSATGSTSYTWNTGATTATILVSPTVTTTYSVISGTGFGTCPGTATYTLNVSPNPSPTVTISGSTITCSGQPDVLTVSGASTYTWSANLGNVTTTTVAPSPTVNTTYQVTGMDGNGCSNTSTFSVTVSAFPNVTTTGIKKICIGNSTTLTANNASTYLWDNGVSTNTIVLTPTVTTIYTVTGTSVNGCSRSVVATVTVTPLPTLTVTPITICYPATATLVATPNTYLSYTWSPGLSSVNGTSVTASPSVTTNYTLSATDNNGCVGSTIATIVSVTNLSVSATASNSVACLGTPVTLTGLGASSYTWTSSAGTMSSNSGAVITVTPSASSTSYTIDGSSGTCSPSSYTLTVNVNPLPTVSALVSPNDSVCNGTPIILDGVGANTYSWTNGASNGIAFSPSVTTTYTVTGTDLNGCKNTSTQKVTINPLPNITITAAPGGNICPSQTVALTATGATSYTWSANAGSVLTNTTIISPLSTTVYTVTGIDALGCVNTRTRTETVRTAPIISISGQNMFCQGASVSATLVATGATSYTWSTGANTSSIVVTPSLTTGYSVVGTGTNVCTTLKEDTVYINPLPNITITNPSYICSGNSGTLTASGANNYVWSTSATTSVIVISPTVTTNYSVTGTDANGCSNSASVTQSVSVCTGIQNLNNELTNVYPNPSNGLITIEVLTPSNILILDVLGKNVYTKLLENGKHQINLSEFSKGLYLMKISSENNVNKTVRLIIQ